jgi:transcriptional regulator with XRE-family HTH domain
MIGEKIQKLRVDRGLTIRELAEKAEITHSMVATFETNQKIPGIKVIRKLANAFNIPEEDLLVELETDNHNASITGLNYKEKLKLAQSLKSEEAVKLISNLIDFCVASEKKEEQTEARFEALRSLIK